LVAVLALVLITLQARLVAQAVALLVKAILADLLQVVKATMVALLLPALLLQEVAEEVLALLAFQPLQV
jgi:hypothetical protein